LETYSTKVRFGPTKEGIARRTAERGAGEAGIKKSKAATGTWRQFFCQGPIDLSGFFWEFGLNHWTDSLFPGLALASSRFFGYGFFNCFSVSDWV
jgi:hypothetical protein